MTKPKAVIFDMDGVLVDSEPIHCEIERRLFAGLKIVVPKDVHHTYMGTSGDFMYADLKSRFNLAASVVDLMEMDELFRYDYFKNLEVIHLNEGILSLLTGLKAAGIKLAVATSSSPEIAKLILERCGITSFFDAVVTASEAGKSKPEPDVYFLAAHKIGVAPADCVVFEDSPNGLLSAKNAGMYCVVLQPNNAMMNQLSMADYKIMSFTEITPVKLFEIFLR